MAKIALVPVVIAFAAGVLVTTAAFKLAPSTPAVSAAAPSTSIAAPRADQQSDNSSGDSKASLDRVLGQLPNNPKAVKHAASQDQPTH